MTDSLHRALATALDGRHLLTHPFYRRWEDGGLADGELTAYAEQYRHFEAMLPEFLATLADRLPEGAARGAVTANWADEIGEPSHLALFDQFAAHYHAGTPAPSPAMTQLLAAYDDVLATSDVAAVAGLLAYETQGAEVAATKALGLEEHYGADDEALSFWRAHAVTELDHASWTLDALESLDADPVTVENAARRVATAWWEFLDEREALQPA